MNNSTADILKPGDIVQDTYRVDHLLGQGGMGATFAGHNLASEHGVAIKVISAQFAENKKAADLFKREANLLRSLQHDAIVRYETILQDKQGRLFLVMELLEGQPLSHYFSKGARLSPIDTLKLGRRLASGLDALAAVGTVHRDISPDNIFVPDGEIQKAKLIDFGLASQTVGSEQSILGDTFAGKFSYSAPEQLGQFDAEVSPRTDAYALGLVLMKAAGLEVPGEGKGLAAGAARRTDIEVPRDKIGHALAELLASLLRLDPAERPNPLTPAFERALAGVGQDMPRSDVTQAAVAGAAAKPKGKGAMIAGAGIAAIAIIGAVVFFLRPQPVLEGPSTQQGAQGETFLQADDAFSEIRAAIDQGDSDSLNAAFGALLALGRDEAEPAADRIRALIMGAEMLDPQTFDTATSPFDAPDASFARRLYDLAAGLGSAEAQAAAARLEE